MHHSLLVSHGPTASLSILASSISIDHRAVCKSCSTASPNHLINYCRPFTVHLAALSCVLCIVFTLGPQLVSILVSWSTHGTWSNTQVLKLASRGFDCRSSTNYLLSKRRPSSSFASLTFTDVFSRSISTTLILKHRKNIYILGLTTASIFNPMQQACTMQCCVGKPRVLVLDFYITRSCQHADSVLVGTKITATSKQLLFL